MYTEILVRSKNKKFYTEIRLHLQNMPGYDYDNFELVTLAVRVLMAETSQVFSTTKTYPSSGILLRGVAALSLPVLLYAFSGNLKVSRM